MSFKLQSINPEIRSLLVMKTRLNNVNCLSDALHLMTRPKLDTGESMDWHFAPGLPRLIKANSDIFGDVETFRSFSWELCSCFVLNFYALLYNTNCCFNSVQFGTYIISAQKTPQKKSGRSDDTHTMKLSCFNIVTWDKFLGLCDKSMNTVLI